MRIAIDARYLNESSSGIAKYSENLLTSLSLIDQTNEYVVFIHPGFSRRLRVGDNFKIEYYSARPVSMRTISSFGKRLHQSGCDFLHSFYPLCPAVGIKKRILTVHDMQPYLVQEMFHSSKVPAQSRLASLFYRATFPHFMRSATWLISVSHTTKRQLSEMFPETEQKTLVVHSGVEPLFLNPPEPQINALVSKKLELPPQYVLYIGSAQPNKNLPNMIRAFAKCRNDFPDALKSLKFILVVGRDRYLSGFWRLIKSLNLQDHVRVLGPLTEEEKHVLYTRAKVLFFATRGEGFGFPLVEAQASGLPILGASDGSIPEVTGDAALLSSPGDVNEMSTKLAELILNDNLRDDLILKGKRNVERFSWQKTAEEVLQIYEMLMW